MEQYNKLLKQQALEHAPRLLNEHGIICKQLKFGNDECLPLYLAKPHWTNRFDPEREKTVGIFFGIWVAPTLLKKNQFAYNIHAKTLQKLPGYKLTPKTFASDFRSVVKSQVSKWPNIRLDYGPSTLLQGNDSSDLNDFGERVEQRILGFVDIYKHIDELLEKSANKA